MITIDTQNDFSLKGATFEIKGTYQIIPNMLKILKRFREEGKSIVHIVRIYKEDGSNVDICRRKSVEGGLKVLVPNSEGVELVKELKPNETRLDSEKLLNNAIRKLLSIIHILLRAYASLNLPNSS